MAESSSSPTEYLEDLLERLDSKKALPQSGPIKSSKDTVSWHAHQEAVGLCDPALIPAIRELIRKAKKVRSFQKLQMLLAGLIHNTRHPDALAVFDYLMERAPASDNLWSSIFEGARKAKVESAMPYAMRNIESPSKGGLALASAIGYLGTMGGVEVVPVVGKLLDNDCHGICPPMYCSFAFSEIEHPDALPYLRRAIERHAKSRKMESSEVYSYSCHAVERIETAPPVSLNEMLVCMWTVPPDVPERIALCSREQSYATISGDASWQIHEIHNADSLEDSQSKAIELAGTKKLHWHQRPWTT